MYCIVLYHYMYVHVQIRQVKHLTIAAYVKTGNGVITFCMVVFQYSTPHLNTQCLNSQETNFYSNFKLEVFFAN